MHQGFSPNTVIPATCPPKLTERRGKAGIHHQQAFSLVELSIVLVILGLLTGGILAGQSLIRAAELRAVTTEYNKYTTAVQSFRDRYMALPGDMQNATKFWGAAHATPSTCVTTTGTGTQTCDGDGDGKIMPSTGSNETFRFWQQLANAGLIEWSFTGVTADPSFTAWQATTPANAPASKLPTGQWWVYNWGVVGSGNAKFAGTYNNTFELGGVASLTEPWTLIFKPQEVWNIDTKLDDGKPAVGKVVSRNWADCTSASSGSDQTAAYLLSVASAQCVIMFTNQF